MGKRSNLLVVVGLAVFLIGGAVVLITTKSTNSSASTGAVTVVVARRSLAAGTSGDQLVAGGLVETKNVKPAEVAPGALNSTSQLAGRSLASSIAPNEQLTQAAFAAPVSSTPATVVSTVGPRALDVPVGKQALAIQVPYVAGGAQLVSPGSLVNIYANVSKGTKVEVPCTELVLPGIQVLGLSSAQSTGTTASPTAVAAAGPDIVYVLAVDPGQAQTLIFFQKNESLYFTVVPKNQPAASPTGCAGYGEFVHK